MMLADVPAPTALEFGGWMLCLACFFAIANGGMKFWRNLRGNDPQPPNLQLGQSVSELTRRIEELENWRHMFSAKQEEAKLEILNAGEERAIKIHEHIESDRVETDRKIEVMPDRIIALLRNTGVIR